MSGLESVDFLDRWQYLIFKTVLFILFLWAAYRLLDTHLHISDLVSKTTRYLTAKTSERRRKS